MSRPAALERRLGHRFENPALLEQALTHRSHGAAHNERLEFLGDGVLGCAIADVLYGRFPAQPEGPLTQLRIRLVRKETLAEVGEMLKLREAIRATPGGSVTESVVADAVEAVIGAIFIDAGYEAAKKFVEMAFDSLIASLDPHAILKDAKTRLQELLQARKKPLPEYRILAEGPLAHANEFTIECSLPGSALTTQGSGPSRQRAEQEAALAMLEKLGK